MPALPLRGWILLASLLVFAVAVLSVVVWAQFTGKAGSQRGLVIHNDRQGDLVVSIEGVEQQRTIAAGHEETFVVKRGQFPAHVIWSERDSDGHAQQLLEYRDLVDAEFRLSIDEDGLHRTTDYRDTPVADP